MVPRNSTLTLVEKSDNSAEKRYRTPVRHSTFLCGKNKTCIPTKFFSGLKEPRQPEILASEGKYLMCLRRRKVLPLL